MEEGGVACPRVDPVVLAFFSFVFVMTGHVEIIAKAFFWTDRFGRCPKRHLITLIRCKDWVSVRLRVGYPCRPDAMM